MNRILTERLLLRTLTSADMDECFLYAAWPDGGWKPHGNKKVTRHLLETVYVGKDSVWGIVLRETGKLVGSIGLIRDYKREHDRVRSIGYAINEECWGQGYMTEAVRAVVRHGFEELRLELISAYTYPWNVGSKRVLEKCGFRYEGTLHMAERTYDGTVFDNDCFALSREEWVEWL